MTSSVSPPPTPPIWARPGDQAWNFWMQEVSDYVKAIGDNVLSHRGDPITSGSGTSYTNNNPYDVDVFSQSGTQYSSTVYRNGTTTAPVAVTYATSGHPAGSSVTLSPGDAVAFSIAVTYWLVPR